MKIDFTGSAFWTAGNNYIIDNAEAQEKAQKMIKDGMLVIIKNGQEFNVFGEKIK